jgi:hypothetical protein
LTIPDLVSQLQLIVFYNVGDTSGNFADTQMCRNTQFENHCSNQSVFINCIVFPESSVLKKFKINLLAETKQNGNKRKIYLFEKNMRALRQVGPF